MASDVSDVSDISDTPLHGGNLSEAVRRFSRPRQEWLDLSTGINPHPYSVPALTPDAWHRLPEADADAVLKQAAQAYYNAPQLLPVAGTQAAIQALPLYRLQTAGRANVAIAGPTYTEHAHRWTKAGHRIVPCTIAPGYAMLDAAAASPAVDVMVICNPNNPSGATFEPAQLLKWHARLAARGGWLVVDEAFGDTEPQASVAAFTERAGLIVLKSVGKFFGLAGLRLGFVVADSAMLAGLAELLGPWSVSGPAQQIGCAALGDRLWQQTMRQTLAAEGARLHALLQQQGFHLDHHATPLYRFLPLPAHQAERLWLHMAQRGIWVRLFAGGARDAATGVRFGLPADENGWQRLGDALAAWCAEAAA
jgi:cobalamin biosynthetic protein CobC